MPATSVTMTIRKPLSDVFAYMNDVSREREWQPNLREAEQTPAGATRVGSRRRYVSNFMGRSLENTYEVTAYEPDRSVSLETRGGATMDAKSEIRWRTVAEGTEVTMSIDGKPKGALRFIPGPMLEAAFDQELRDALERLKKILED